MTWDVTFLQKSYGKYTQVEKPVVVTFSYDESNEEEEHEMVPVVNNNNSLNIVSDFNSDLNEDDFENSKDNFFNEDVNDKFLPKPLSKQKWFKL